MHEFTSHAPIVRSTVETLWARAQIPTGSKNMQPYEVAVTWIRRSQSRVVFMHGGHTVQQMGTYVDSAGPLTCLQSAVERARREAHRFGVGPDSSASIDVITTITDWPVLAATSYEGMRAKGSYRVWRSLPNSFCLRVPNPDAHKPGHGGAWIWPPFVDSIQPITELLTWTTKASSTDQEQVSLQALSAAFFPSTTQQPSAQRGELNAVRSPHQPQPQPMDLA